MKHVPYLDMVATADDAGSRVSASIINRHPVKTAKFPQSWAAPVLLQPEP